jgi:predicted ATPase/class 3 adenylate cyclase
VLVEELGIEPSPSLRALEQAILAQDVALEAPAVPAPQALPRGTVTLLFTDIEGSTRLLQDLGRERYVEALASHRKLLREAFGRHGGVEVEMQGDSFHFAFKTAPEAAAAAASGQRALADHSWPGEPLRVRIGLHTGAPAIAENLYAGLEVHRTARIMAAAHGGQVLVSQVTRELLAGEAELRDLGDHRLKDLRKPERLYQLLVEGLPARFPPPKSLSNTNLPTSPTPLVGRERELAELVELASQARLVTLTGPGGSGKTRLALELAARLEKAGGDPSFLVELAPLTEPGLVLPAIARTVGLEEADRALLAGTLSGFLRERRLLLVLDNFEHLIDAAPDIAALLADVPGLTVLATSRTPLHVRAEFRYEVGPLAIKDARALFIKRARAAQIGFEPTPAVEALCRRLDGLPLAIELAAARVAVLSPAAILERMEEGLPLLTGGPSDAPERQRTLDATIRWSFELLRAEEQRSFACLSMFAGGCTLEAAEEVADADLDTLASLVDKSLLRRDGERYVMLETIREYARERLEHSGTAGRTMERLAEYLLKLGEEQQGSFRSSADRGLSFARLEPEFANFQAALNWAFRTPAPTLALHLAILPFEGRMFSWNSAETWVEQALPYIEDAPLRLRADVLRAAGVALSSDVERSIGLLEESLSLYRQLGADARVVNALRWLGRRYMRVGLQERARALLEESLTLAMRTEDSRGTYEALALLGELERRAGNLKEAADFLTQSVTQARRSGDDHSVANVLHSLADLALERSEMQRAVHLYSQSLKLSHELGLRQTTLYCLAGLASALAASGDCKQVGRLWGAAEAGEQETGWRIAGRDKAFYEERVRACADDASAAFAAALERGRKMSLDEAVESALSAS